MSVIVKRTGTVVQVLEGAHFAGRNTRSALYQGRNCKPWERIGAALLSCR